MSTELVLALRLEAKAAMAGIDEIRTALAALKREAAGASRGGASASSGSRGPTPLQQAKIDTQGIIGEQKRRTEAAKTSANEIIGANKAITAASQSASAQRIASARSGAAEDQRASASRLAGIREMSAEDKRAALSRLSGIREASAEEKRALQDRLGAVRQGLSEDKRASGQRLALTRELASEDKRASAGRIAASKEASAAAVGANRTAASSSQAAAQATRAQTAEIQRQAAALRLARLEQAGLTGATHAHTNALGQALKTGAQLAAVYGSLRAVSASFGAGIDYNKTLEGARLAIASVVAANEKVVDSQGRQIEGVEKLKIAQSQVAGIMGQLVITARETGTPIQTLVSGFQAAVAPAAAMGLTLGQTKDVVVGMTNAMKAMNVPLDQQRQEIQDILNGDIDRNSHVAKNLQLSSAILAKWKDQGITAKEVLGLLKDYNVAAEEFKKTFSGATTVMKGNFEALMGTMTGPTFDLLKVEFGKLADVFASDEARARAVEWGESIASGLRTAIPVAEIIAKVLVQAGDRLALVLRTVGFLGDAATRLGTRKAAVDVYKGSLQTTGLTPSEQQGVQEIPAPFTFKNKNDYLDAILTASAKKGSKLANVDATKMRALGDLFDAVKFADTGVSPYKQPEVPYTTSPIGKPGGNAFDVDAVKHNLANALKLARKPGMTAIQEALGEQAAYQKALNAIPASARSDEAIKRYVEDLQTNLAVATAAVLDARSKANKDAIGKGSKAGGGSQSFGARLQAQALADMPDESARIASQPKAEADAQHAADLYLKSIRSEGFRFLGREAATSAKLTAIDLRDQEAMGRIGNLDPGVALTKEIEARKAIVKAEFKEREAEAKRLREEDFQANYSKAIKIEQDAAHEHRVAMAEILSDERIGRMAILKDEEEVRMAAVRREIQARTDALDEWGRSIAAITSAVGNTMAGVIQNGFKTPSGITSLVGQLGGGLLGAPIKGVGFAEGSAFGGMLGSVVGAALDKINSRTGGSMDKAVKAFDKAVDKLLTTFGVPEAPEQMIGAVPAAPGQSEADFKKAAHKKNVDELLYGMDTGDRLTRKRLAVVGGPGAEKKIGELDAKTASRNRLLDIANRYGADELSVIAARGALANGAADADVGKWYGLGPQIIAAIKSSNQELSLDLQALTKVTEDRGTERNPLITQPPKRSAFDFAPRSFFFRGGRGGGGGGGGGGIPSGSTLRGLGGSSGGRGAGGRAGGMVAV